MNHPHAGAVGVADSSRRARFLERAKARWPDERGSRAALLLLGCLILAGVGLRLWLMSAWRPGFLGYPDSGTYLLLASQNSVLDDTLRPGGYPLFLRGVHTLDSNLSTVIVIQHALGVATAALLYMAVRRVTRSPWPGLLPAAVVLLGGTEIFVEHAILTESLFIFLQATAVYAVARTIDSDHLAWPLLAGLAAAAATTVRVFGLFLVPLLVLAVVVARRRPFPRAALRGGLALIAAIAVLLPYAFAHESRTGQFGFTRAGAWHQYARVAPFAKCSAFTPPEHTRALCESTPPSERPGPLFYVFNGATPGPQNFGGPFSTTPETNTKLKAFARQVVLHQPLDYLNAVVTDMTRYVDDDLHNYPGQGLTFDGLVRDNLLTGTVRELQPYWDTPTGYFGAMSRMSALESYERNTRIQGALMIVLFILALAAPLSAPRGARCGAAFLTALTLCLLVFPIAFLYWDLRLAVPAFGVLGAAAGVGAWAAVSRIRPRARRLRRGWRGKGSAAPN